MEINTVQQVASALLAINHHFANNGYTLTIEEFDGDVNKVVLTGPPGFSAAVVGAELGSALASVGMPLMGHDFVCELNWPANAKGVVLSIKAVG